MKKIINVLLVAVMLSLVPVTYASAQTVDNLRPPTRTSTPPKKKPQNRTQKWEVKSVADLKSKLIGEHDVIFRHDKSNQTQTGGCAVQNDLSVYGSYMGLNEHEIYCEFGGKFTVESVSQIYYSGSIVFIGSWDSPDAEFHENVYLQFQSDGKGKYIASITKEKFGKATIELVLK